MFRHLRPVLIIAVILASASAFAEKRADQFQTGRNIVIPAGESTGDLACIGCSVIVSGQVTGDVFAMGGNVILEPGAQVTGSVSTVVGDVRLQAGTQIAGDVSAVAGMVRRDPQAAIAGDVSSLGGKGWMLVVFILPLLFLGGLVALLVWLVQRIRRPVPAAV
jgi:cytoskeletal protein CcmA (bactofilin family)